MTKDELREAIKEAERQVDAVFRGLTAEQGEHQIHQEEGGWTARQVLAHLTSNDARVDMFIDPNATEESLYGPPFWAWNDGWVDLRDDRDLASLLDEFHQQVATTLRKLETVPESTLQRQVPNNPNNPNNPPRTVFDWFEIVCTRHATRHASIVEETLGLKQPAG